MARVYLVMYWGGTSHLLWNRDAAVLVFGGTFASMLISSQLETVLRLPRALVIVLFKKKKTYEPQEIIGMMVNFAEKALRTGVDSLGEDVEGIKDRFLADGIGMVIDGLSPEIVRENLLKEITFIRKRHYHVSK